MAPQTWDATQRSAYRASANRHEHPTMEVGALFLPTRQGPLLNKTVTRHEPGHRPPTSVKLLRLLPRQ